MVILAILLCSPLVTHTMSTASSSSSAAAASVVLDDVPFWEVADSIARGDWGRFSGFLERIAKGSLIQRSRVLQEMSPSGRGLFALSVIQNAPLPILKQLVTICGKGVFSTTNGGSDEPHFLPVTDHAFSPKFSSDTALYLLTGYPDGIVAPIRSKMIQKRFKNEYFPFITTAVVLSLVDDDVLQSTKQFFVDNEVSYRMEKGLADNPLLVNALGGQDRSSGGAAKGVGKDGGEVGWVGDGEERLENRMEEDA